MKLIITRHGETEQNKARILQGQIHGALSELGKKQAQKLAARLANYKIDHIFASDLRRATDTAIEISKKHPNIPVQFVGALREINMGSYQGKSAPKDLKQNRYQRGYFKSKGGEEYEDLLNRVKIFLDKLIPDYGDKTILFVVHNGTGQALITALLNKNWDYIKEVGKLENTSLTIFDLEDNKNFSLKLFNCAKHLE